MAVQGPSRIMAPFDESLLKDLIDEQNRPVNEHPSPFNPNPCLCPNDSSILAVTKYGYCCMLLTCDYVQNWAFDPNW